MWDTSRTIDNSRALPKYFWTIKKHTRTIRKIYLKGLKPKIHLKSFLKTEIYVPYYENQTRVRKIMKIIKSKVRQENENLFFHLIDNSFTDVTVLKTIVFRITTPVGVVQNSCFLRFMSCKIISWFVRIMCCKISCFVRFMWNKQVHQLLSSIRIEYNGRNSKNTDNCKLFKSEIRQELLINY